MRYQILSHHGTENWCLDAQAFDTLDDAVKHAIQTCYGSPFKIVQVVDWEVKAVVQPSVAGPINLQT